MNQKIKALTVCCLFSIVGYGQNQNVLPPSPNSAALGKYVDNPTSLYTGLPSISVPLYDINMKNFSFPISLSYHAGGIKIEDASSNVGLGWVLNAGGCITRVVKDIPDDFEGTCEDGEGADWNPECQWGLFHSGQNIHDIDFLDAYNKDYTDHDYSYVNVMGRYFYSGWPGGYELVFEKEKDTEPDVFYFNFCGKAGQFVFQVIDGVRTVKFLSDYDLSISHTLDSDGLLSQFSITDENGVIYIFDAVESTSVTIQPRTHPSITMKMGGVFGWTSEPGEPVHYEYNSSWYLTKVVTPSNEELILTYTDEETFSQRQSSEQTCRDALFPGVAMTYNPNLDPTYSYRNLHYNFFWTTTKSKRITTISNLDTKIDFESDLVRQDAFTFSTDAAKRPKAITGLTVSSKLLGFSRLKRYVFTQDYFESVISSTYTINGVSYSAGADDGDFYFKRLRLRSIKELGITNDCEMNPTTFEYKYNGFPGYTTAHRLPYRHSYQQDLWGYYNAATENTTSMIPKLFVYPGMYSDSRRFSVYKRSLYTGSEYVLAGANRVPSASVMDIGMLTKIIHPTGGSTTYEYEPHTFRDGGEDFIGGGLRIKKITKNDGINNSSNLVYNYTYIDAGGNSSGRVMSIPSYAICDGVYDIDIDNTSELAYKLNTTRFSLPQSALGSTRGSNIGYRRVIESISGNGKTEYEYSTPAYWHEYNDTEAPSPSPDCSIADNGTCDDLYAAVPVTHLFPLSTYRSSFFNFSMNPATINSSPNPENPNYDWNRGHLLWKKIYNQSGALVHAEQYQYKIWYRNGLTYPTRVYGLKFNQYKPRAIDNAHTYPYNEGGCWRVAKYHYLSDVQKVLESKTVTEYEPGTTNSLVTTETYRHDATNHANLTQSTAIASTGDEVITRIKYPYDYSYMGPGGMDGVTILKDRKIRSVPVETTTFIKKSGTEYLKSADLNTYEAVGSVVVPKRNFKVETASMPTDFSASYTATTGDIVKDLRYVQKEYVRRHDANGNPLEIELNTSNQTVCYIWGYRNQYPIAKIANATYAQIEAALSATTLTNLNNGYRTAVPPEVPTPGFLPLPDSEVRDLLSPLRTSLPQAQLTIYTYKPLVGMTSETSVNGFTTTYEYDCLNRLSVVKDHDGKILKTYTYKVQGAD